jgi:hypothetical protein
MTDRSAPILDYSRRTPDRPWGRWLLAAYLAAAAAVWHATPRLTPTGFPNRADMALLILLAPVSFVAGRYSAVPGWAFSAAGAAAVALFLLANLQDNNFRFNTTYGELLLPWSGMTLGGAVAARMIALAARWRYPLRARGSMQKPAHSI